MNKKVFSLLGTLLFLALLCKPVGATDVMSWSPRTPAGGGYISDPNFYFKMGTVVEYGSQSLLFNEYTVTTVVEEETANSEFYQIDTEGNTWSFPGTTSEKTTTSTTTYSLP
jgi:hypothetical protein